MPHALSHLRFLGPQSSVQSTGVQSRVTTEQEKHKEMIGVFGDICGGQQDMGDVQREAE